MKPALHALIALQTDTVQWDRPPAGTLRRGIIWLSHPAVAVGVVLAVLATLLGLALFRRFRRRSKSP